MSVSIIIPARNEKWLSKTIDDIYAKATEDIEVIVVLDGPTQYPVTSHSDVKVIDNTEPIGIRPSINQGVKASTGDYILKVDAHCMFGWEFDKKLREDCDDNWVVVARRYTLDLETWDRRPRIVDYYYLSCPWTHPKKYMMQSCPWITRTEERIDDPIDELMCFQGSLWFMSRKHWNWLGGLSTDKEVYAEHHEISMKTWLGGREVVINKNTWYAHPKMFVGGYHMSMRQVYTDHYTSAMYWINNKWEGQKHDFDWLIEKFWPLPTEHNRHRIEKYYWPEDWRKFYNA